MCFRKTAPIKYSIQLMPLKYLKLTLIFETLFLKCNKCSYNKSRLSNRYYELNIKQFWFYCVNFSRNIFTSCFNKIQLKSPSKLEKHHLVASIAHDLQLVKK